VVCTLDYGGGVCSKLLQSKSRQLEPLASPIGLLALVHTTRLTGGCDFENHQQCRRFQKAFALQSIFIRAE
ncbi:MAG: hypothetical protein IJX28_02105, partial [Clostridia bacterium]|nr:hypothetical protein [Clostridia bacterium]